MEITDELNNVASKIGGTKRNLDAYSKLLEKEQQMINKLKENKFYKIYH
jgi:hypothetical protein